MRGIEEEQLAVLKRSALFPGDQWAVFPIAIERAGDGYRIDVHDAILHTDLLAGNRRDALENGHRLRQITAHVCQASDVVRERRHYVIATAKSIGSQHAIE